MNERRARRWAPRPTRGCGPSGRATSRSASASSCASLAGHVRGDGRSSCWSDHDRLAQLATLTVPTLVVVGEQDTPFLEASQAMAEAIPGAELVVLPDAGHSPQFEAPEAWWDVVSGFLDGRLSAGATVWKSMMPPRSAA